jgi:hypothetical protein
MRQSITRLPDYSITRFGFVAIGVTLAALARGLPPHAFFVGDPGVKLIAARNALAHPTRPFEIPLPIVGTERVPYVDPFFAIHGNHTHAVTPELFPLVTAPLLWAFGLRGAYVLPAAGLLLALAATAWLALALDRRRSPLVVLLTAFLATPLLFYGLELWEHAAAAGVAAFAAAIFVRNAHVGRVFGPGALPGLLFGIATLLRPEALWFAVAVLASSRWLPSPPRRATVALTVVGIVAAILPIETYTLLHFGSPIPPHIAGNPAIASPDWLAIRANVISSWFGADRLTSFWRVAPAILLGVVPLLGSLTEAPAAMLARGKRDPRASISESSRRGWGPGAIGKKVDEPVKARNQADGRGFLFAVAVIAVALVVLTAPNDGGGQWGPRYLLLAYIPLAILASDVVSYIASYVVSGFSRTSGVPESGFSRILGFALVASVALGSAWIQRAAYKELRAAKTTYARLVDFVGLEVQPGGYAITDLWWLDQAAASLSESRHFLYVADANAAADALRRLDRIAEPNVVLVRSRVESAGSLDMALQDTCYVEDAGREIPERTLYTVRLRRSCRPDL